VANSWREKVGQEIEPSSWDECAALLLRSGGEETIYRGHRRYDWQLHSSLERALLQRARQWDDRKYQVMRSPVADAQTAEWARSLEQKQTLSFQRNAVMLEVPGLPKPWDTVGWWEVSSGPHPLDSLTDFLRGEQVVTGSGSSLVDA
jgi:hypothetical protein